MIKSILKYSGFTLNAVKEQYAYKFRAIIWTFYNFILLFVQYFLWNAIFEANGGALYDISVKKYLSYVVMGMITNSFLHCLIDGSIAEEIKSGNVSMNLIKPYNYIYMNFAKQIGYTLGSVISLSPLIIVAFFMTGLSFVSVQALLFFIVSIFLAYMIVFLFNMFLGMLAFWITNYWGLRLLKWHVFVIFSGELMAINMFFKIGNNGISNFPIPLPEAAVQLFFKTLGIISYCLPFQAMNYTPTAIYTGMINDTRQILVHLGVQVFWIIFMLGLVRLVWSKAKNQITILGG